LPAGRHFGAGVFSYLTHHLIQYLTSDNFGISIMLYSVPDTLAFGSVESFLSVDECGELRRLMKDQQQTDVKLAAQRNTSVHSLTGFSTSEIRAVYERRNSEYS
jgi:hypothetical protein